MKKFDRKTVIESFRTSIPIMVTFVVIGIGYGILMQKHGFGPLWSLLSGFVIYSGTAQFVSVAMLADSSFFMAAVTALMISARHIFFSISMISRYKNEKHRKWYLYYGLCDETYAMLSRDKMPEGVNVSLYRVLVTALNQSSWIIGSVLGGLLGSLLEFDSSGIDFAMTALFTTVFIEQWLSSKCHIPSILGVAATLICCFLFGRDLFLIPSMVVIIIVLTLLRKKIESEGELNDERL